MKKKLFILVFSTFVLSTHLLAHKLIHFSVGYDQENTTIGHGYGKSPIRPPMVYIDDYTLSFTADHPEYVLTIRNEENDVVYTTVVSSSETQVVLPATLSGEYQIELAMGGWLFTGWITLN